jgi:NCAIR mutase (PurE)-related protein
LSDAVKKILDELSRGLISADEAEKRLSRFCFEDLGFARIDHGRVARTGFPEVVYAASKTPDEVVAIARRMLDFSGRVLITRMAEAHVQAVEEAFAGCPLHINKRARTARIGEAPAKTGRVVLISAGTSDIPVAEEARETLLALGITPHVIYDAGVAGIHRLLSERDLIISADAVIVVAGMEGALASVVGGLAPCPVIGVPTSVGYGASFGGISALLAMLNSCSPNVVTVNIDNGFGAGFVAAMISRERGAK